MTVPTTDPSSAAVEAEQVPQLFKYLAALTAAHLLTMISLASPFFELVKTGAVSMLAFLLLIVGSLSLYVGVFNAAMRGRAGKKAFVIAAVLLAAYCWKWYVPSLVATVIYGSLLAIGGLRLSYMKAAATPAP